MFAHNVCVCVFTLTRCDDAHTTDACVCVCVSASRCWHVVRPLSQCVRVCVCWCCDTDTQVISNSKSVFPSHFTHRGGKRGDLLVTHAPTSILFLPIPSFPSFSRPSQGEREKRGKGRQGGRGARTLPFFPPFPWKCADLSYVETRVSMVICVMWLRPPESAKFEFKFELANERATDYYYFFPT